MADEYGVDLGQVAGSGTGGRVRREDVQQFLTMRSDAAGSAQKDNSAAAPAPSATAASAATTRVVFQVNSQLHIALITRRREQLSVSLLKSST